MPTFRCVVCTCSTKIYQYNGIMHALLSKKLPTSSPTLPPPHTPPREINPLNLIQLCAAVHLIMSLHETCLYVSNYTLGFKLVGLKVLNIKLLYSA